MNSDDFKDREKESSQVIDGNETMDSSETSKNRLETEVETETPIEQTETSKIQVHGNPEVDAYESGKVHGNSEAEVYESGKVHGNPEVDVYVNGKSEPETHLYSGLYAGFWTRFWAYLLDLVVIGSINRMIINPVFQALDVSLFEDGIFSPVAIATAIVFYLYFVLMTKFLGQTLGKMVFGLKVVELDGKGLTWGTVIFREWIGRFISATIMVLYVVVAFTKKKQGLHDLFADTTVIYEPR
jgi:uncharacterized RDD family membrane protein YckC